MKRCGVIPRDNNLPNRANVLVRPAVGIDTGRTVFDQVISSCAYFLNHPNTANKMELGNFLTINY